MRFGSLCQLPNSWSGPSYVVACAPHVRHFIMHVRRASHRRAAAEMLRSATIVSFASSRGAVPES